MQIDCIPDCEPSKSLNVRSCCQDSRLAGKNDLFFALKGQKVDGHDFLLEVAKKGACAAVVDVSYRGPDFGLKLFRTKNVLCSLHKLAQCTLAKRNTKIIAITGSLGKTTTKEFLAKLMEDEKVAKSCKSYNSKATLPLNILNADPLCTWLILEMGMSKALELLQLVDIACPYFAMITKIAYVHAENFDSLKDIAKAKTEIFSSEKTVYRLACHELLDFVQLEDVQTFSMKNSQADFCLKKRGSTWVFVAQKKEIFAFEKPQKIPEVYMENLLAALAGVYELKLPMENIVAKISKLSPYERRLEPIEKKNVHFINDAYNSNTVSLKAALSFLQMFEGRKIAVLSEMLELGKFSQMCHEEVAKYALDKVDVLFCLGNEAKILHETFQKEKKESFYFEKKEKLTEALLPFLKAGDTVLLKGARFWALETILEQF